MKIQVGKIITEEEDEEERDLVTQDRPMIHGSIIFFGPSPYSVFYLFYLELLCIGGPLLRCNGQSLGCHA